MKQVEQLLNNRPVRKFNYKTPNQVQEEILHFLLELTKCKNKLCELKISIDRKEILNA